MSFQDHSHAHLQSFKLVAKVYKAPFYSISFLFDIGLFSSDSKDINNYQTLTIDWGSRDHENGGHARLLDLYLWPFNSD